MKPTYPAIGDGVTIRLACCVPHCRRTFRNDKQYTPWPKGSSVICGDHWRRGDLALRHSWKAAHRLYRKASRMVPSKRQRFLCRKLTDICHARYDRVVKSAIERTMGIN